MGELITVASTGSGLFALWFGVRALNDRGKRREKEDREAILQAMQNLRPEARGFDLMEEAERILGRSLRWGIGGFYITLEELEREGIFGSRWEKLRPGRQHRGRLYSFTANHGGL